ncbi:MAG: hypothetical protein KDA57_16465 [Planctomycetales bacterium]|nr:hypothetical protein [Planctomycetales bacterium]
MPEPPKLDTTDHTERDCASLSILGYFFAILGVLVLAGTFWSLDNYRAVVVNLISGASLTFVGLGMIYYVRRKRHVGR